MSTIQMQSVGSPLLRTDSNMHISSERAKNISLRLSVISLDADNISHHLPGSITMTAMLMGRIILIWGHLYVCVYDRAVVKNASTKTKQSFSWCFFHISGLNTIVFVTFILYCLPPFFFPFSSCSLAFQTFPSVSGGRASASALLAQTRVWGCQQRLSRPMMSKAPLLSKPTSFTNSTFWPVFYSEAFFCVSMCVDEQRCPVRVEKNRFRKLNSKRDRSICRSRTDLHKC